MLHISKNFNYISVPKTASQAIHRALEIKNIRDINHVSVSKMPDRFSFAFVREPLERLVSWWRYHKLSTGISGIYRDSFESWVNAGFPIHWDKEFLNRCGVSSPLNQWEFVCNNGKIACDFIGLYEELQDDFETICVLLDANVIPYLDKVCPSVYRKPIVSKQATEIIKNKFKLDYQLYEYVRAKRRGLKGIELF